MALTTSIQIETPDSAKLSAIITENASEFETRFYNCSIITISFFCLFTLSLHFPHSSPSNYLHSSIPYAHFLLTNTFRIWPFPTASFPPFFPLPFFLYLMFCAGHWGEQRWGTMIHTSKSISCHLMLSMGPGRMPWEKRIRNKGKYDRHN